MSSAMKQTISLCLDYNYDPNNTYFKQDFAKFNLPEQMAMLEDILCRQKITEHYTLYYEQIVCIFLEEYIKILSDICSRKNSNTNFKKKLEEEFELLLKLLRNEVGEFIKNIYTVNNQFLFKFLNNFSLEERKSVCILLEFYALLTGKNEYKEFKEKLEVYNKDLSYNERIQLINNQLDMILNNEILKSNFIIVAENIKETVYEINYLLESISNLEDNENNRNNMEPYLLYIYETLSEKNRDIVIKAIKCLMEQNSNQILKIYLEEFENKKNGENKPSIFISIKNAFENIYKSLIPNHDNSAK
jgi:hypothetical protein